VFHDDLVDLMFAFGDVSPPDPAAVHLLDSMLLTHLLELLTASTRLFPHRRGGDRLRTEAVLFLLRRWPNRHERCMQIIRKNAAQHQSQSQAAKRAAARKGELKAADQARRGKGTGEGQGGRGGRRKVRAADDEDASGSEDDNAGTRRQEKSRRSTEGGNAGRRSKKERRSKGSSDQDSDGDAAMTAAP
jgi:hypothetical protein